MIEFGVFKRKYTLVGVEIQDVKDIIINNLNERNADEIEDCTNFISFNNHFYNRKRLNVSLMSLIDAGYFNFSENKDGVNIVAYFSIKRMLLATIIFLCVLTYMNRDELFIAVFVCVLFSLQLLISIFRYMFFLKDIVEIIKSKAS